MKKLLALLLFIASPAFAANPAALGWCATNAAPSVSGDLTTGLCTEGASEVDIEEGGTIILKVTSGGANIASGSLLLNAVNGIKYPSVDTTANGTVFIGAGAGVNIGTSTAAYESTAVGYNALNGALTSAAVSNTAVGNTSLAANTAGNSNTAVGYKSLAANTTGINNTAVGAGAMQLLVTGTDSTAIGQDAALNQTGSPNTSVGNQANDLLTSGADNVAVGNVALYGNNTGSNNTAVGDNTMTNSFGGGVLQNGNTALGSKALFVAGAITDDTAVGYQSLLANTTGSENTAIGFNTLAAVTTGANNTAIGYNAGHATLTTGTFDIYIGSGSAASAAGVNYEIALGGTGLGSDTTEIGVSGTTTATTIYGTLAVGTMNTGTGSYVCATAGLLTVESTACPASTEDEKNAEGVLNTGTAAHALEKLIPSVFTYKDTATYGEKPYVGIYAQDVAKMDDRCAAYDKKGKLQNYDERCIVAYLVAAEQEHDAALRDLQSRDGVKLHKCLGFLPWWCEGSM